MSIRSPTRWTRTGSPTGSRRGRRRSCRSTSTANRPTSRRCEKSPTSTESHSIEDAAQAHLATYRGKPVGGFGLAAGFSFYPGKNLGACGEGGAVVTNDDALAARMRALRDHAQTQRYHHAEIGFNYRMDALQGAVLGIKLKHLARVDRAAAGAGRPLSQTAPRSPARLADRRRRTGNPSGTCSSFSTRTGTASARGSKHRAFRPVCTIRFRSTCSRPTRTWVTSPATSRCPSGSLASASRCRSSRR